MSNKFTYLLIRIFIFSLLYLAGSSLHAEKLSQKKSDEALFKAAFIYNFAKFTTWPESAFKETNILKLCTIGKQEPGFDLKRLSGKVIQGRAVSIKSIERNQSVNDCHMLYITKSEKNHYEKILKESTNKPLLTVSDLPNFVKHGGIIQFYRKKGKTHLIVNLDTARNANLEISSRLLILAKVITSKTRP